MLPFVKPSLGILCKENNMRFYFSQLIEGILLLYQLVSLTYARLRFTTEAPAECADIFRAYQTGAPASGPFTRGLYYRGVD